MVRPGFDREHIGKGIDVVFPGIHESVLPTSFAEVMRSGQARDLGEMPYNDASLNGWFSVRAFPLSEQCIGISFENVTERKQAAEVLRLSVLQDEIISAQQDALAELTTPLLVISEHTVVMPLIGTIDSRRAQQVMESLLNGVSERQARTAILDITGVSVVDTQVANALLRAAQAVKLLGATVILTGIRPEVAQTLIGLGIDLNAIVTRSSLQSGIAYALNS